jgi:hypothetical protein
VNWAHGQYSAAMVQCAATAPRLAVAGDGCYEHVAWARGVGIHEQPAWYPGLAAGASFADFQCFLAGRSGDWSCEPPCGCSPGLAAAEVEHGAVCGALLAWSAPPVHGPGAAAWEGHAPLRPLPRGGPAVLRRP